MNTKFLSLMASLFVPALSLPAANIAWVSFHPGDSTPSSAAATAGFTNAPDAGYTKLLAANGHNVTRFPSVANIDTNPDLLNALNTNDVVILSRSVGSGDYQDANETAAWNSSITKPMIIVNGYLTRGGTGGGSRLGLTQGETMADANVTELRLRINAVLHPIFKDIALDGNNLMVNPYAFRQTFTNATTGVTTNQNGISINNNTIAAGGTTYAVVGTAGAGGLNGLAIGELPAGTVTTHFSDVLAARRLIFLTGSRESGITSQGAGMYDLAPDGAKMFLNAVTYLLTPAKPMFTIPLAQLSNLMAGDRWNFNAGVIGDEPTDPLYYQWYQNDKALPGGTTAILDFASLDPTNAGLYQLVATNSSNSLTSSVGRLEFAVFPPASITNSLVSYWPLDAVGGTKTVDRVSGYDLTLVNMTGADLVDGKWSKAFQFNGTNSLLERIHTAGDALPIYQHSDFTVSFWVNGYPQSDRRVFAESSTTATAQMFDLGTHNGAADGSVDIFIRPDSGAANPDHAHSTGIAFDGTWHNVVYVQRQVAPGVNKAQLWVDGVLDPIMAAYNPPRPLTMNTTSLGALRRASVSAWFAGLIDETAVWDRALSPAEIAILQVTAITNVTPKVQPLAIASFKTDLPAVVTGGSTTLRWDVSKDANQVTIDVIGDVTSQTSVGIGSASITPAQSTSYVLTITRGADTLSATTSVAVVEGVAANWTLLDNFDQAEPGNLFNSGYWNDTSGNALRVVSANGNQAVRTTSSGIGFLNLRGLTVLENQTRTLFFRIIAGETNASALTNIVGLTDKSQRSYGDEYVNIGPVLYAAAFTNDLLPAVTNAWYLGARNGLGAPIDYLPPALGSGVVYNVWIDINNVPMSDPMGDQFKVFIQPEGGTPRTALLPMEYYLSDRDPYTVDPVLGGMLPNLDKLVLMGNHATFSAIFDDFYLSTSGYNTTVPKAYTLGQPGPLSFAWVNNQLEIRWTSGTLQQADTITGQFTDVPNNPTSPYLVTPTGTKFYRTRQ
jgi:hypothetical protein